MLDVDPVVDDDGKTVWNVTEEDCQSGCVNTKLFDAVLVCNG